MRHVGGYQQWPKVFPIAIYRTDSSIVVVGFVSRQRLRDAIDDLDGPGAVG
jgi:hypothetical protein